MINNTKIIIFCSAALILIGIIMIYSSSAVYAHAICGDSMYFLKKHLLYLSIGLVAVLTSMLLPIKMIKDNARLLLLFSIFLLVLVLVPGVGSMGGGARRWIRIAGIGFQPSEFAKIALIVYLADFTSRKRYKMTSFLHGFIPASFVIALIAGLVLIEPDLGTAVSVIIIGFSILFIAGINLKYISSICLLFVPFLAFAIISAPYRLQRFMTFLNPSADPQGSGFQLNQSFIALGSGGLFGYGLGNSRQKLFFLPQSHTDFIYSIIGEETGFLGAILVLVLFLLLVLYTFRLSLKIKDLFVSRVVFGIGMMIAFESTVNIGVSSGVLPTKGLPLPFISYGGTSLIVHMIAIGLILSFSRNAESVV
ncbi:MAG: putative lipid II flippase FtsW [Candidatus Omnitrophica bacterium]|nr:putative lipid II flippase FtsW [Candidatus Omnitrophota bacterium]